MNTIPPMETQQTPARLIRAAIEASPYRAPPPTPRQLARQNRIRGAAALAMARFGRHAVNFNNLAIGLTISPATLRRDFVDMDYLLFDILWTYLGKIYQSVLDLGPHPTEAAIRAATAIQCGTPEERALMDQAHTLPEDLRARLEEAQDRIRARLDDTSLPPLQDWQTQPPAPPTPRAEHNPSRAPKLGMRALARIAARHATPIRAANVTHIQKERGERGAPPTPPATNRADPTG